MKTYTKTLCAKLATIYQIYLALENLIKLKVQKNDISLQNIIQAVIKFSGIEAFT